MRLAVFGAGYVGLVTAACFAEMGNHVACVDVDAARVERLRRGEVPIHEPGLSEMIVRGAQRGRIRFTTDAREAIADAEVIFIAVGTPPNEDGAADLSHVLTVARTIGSLIEEPVVVVDKSTVPVGTADRVRDVRKVAQEPALHVADFDPAYPRLRGHALLRATLLHPDRACAGVLIRFTDRVRPCGMHACPMRRPAST